MKKLFCIILSLMLIMAPLSVDSGGLDIIYNALNNKDKQSNIGNELILRALNKDKEDIEIEIIKDKKEIENRQEIKPNKPGKERMVGIDISKWNGKIDWKAVKKAGVEFVIIRAGYGTGYVDPYFKKNIEAAIDNDMLIGVYWFSYSWTYQGAKAEAEKCYKTIKPYKKHIDLPIFWDFEYDSVNYARKHGHSISKKKASMMADTFCTTIKNKGMRTGIYTNMDYANNYFTKEVLNKYHCWIAQWTNSCTYKEHYIIWQCTDKYYIGGKKFDKNYLYYNRYLKDISSKKEIKKKVRVKATAYAGDSITSTGIKPRWGVIAVDPSVIPYGSRVYIPAFKKIFIAEDCGGAIKGKRIDIFMNSEREARQWGVKNIDVYIIE